MSFPTYTLQFGFGVSARVLVIGRSLIGRAVLGGSNEDGVSWTTVSGVRELHSWRGRTDELGDVSAGTLRAVLDNASGDFSPENAAGLYYANLKPMVRAKAYASYGGTDYGLHYGWCDPWIPVIRGEDPTVDVQATDLFWRLAREELSASLSQQLTGARIQAVCGQLEWPSSLQDVDAGQSTLPAYVPDKTKMLEHLQAINAVEGGIVWIAGDGKLTFRDRHARLTDTRSQTSQATFGGLSGFPFRVGSYEYGTSGMTNYARATRTGSTEQTTLDDDSRRRYGLFPKDLSSDHFLTDLAAQAWANWQVSKGKTPIPRLSSIIVEAGGDAALWPVLLGLEINDRITVVHEFPGKLGLNRDFWIEGIHHDIAFGPFRHEVTLQLSAADAVGKYLVIGRGTIGNSRLAY
jgi:hypothetical protein